MQDASDNAVCRLFKVHDFVPLFARMIKIVNQSRKTPLFTENRPSRCTDLFRLGMFLFCSDKVPGTTKYRDMEVHWFVPLWVRFATKRELALFCSAFNAPWLTPKSRLTGHLKCSALLHSIVYFTSKQRSLSGWASQNVPILFRACARSRIYRGFRPYRGALFCSALWFLFKFDRHNFVAFRLKCS